MRHFDLYPFVMEDVGWNKTENGYTLCIDVPGIPKEKIEISYNRNKMNIKGEEGNRNFNYYIYTYDDMNTEKTDATLLNGVLTISVPFIEEKKPRTIQIK